MNQEKATRHLALELDDIKNELIRTVNTAVQKGIPCFLLEYIVAELNTQIHNVAENEKNAARQEEVRMLAMQQKEEAETEDEDN